MDRGAVGGAVGGEQVEGWKPVPRVGPRLIGQRHPRLLGWAAGTGDGHGDRRRYGTGRGAFYEYGIGGRQLVFQFQSIGGEAEGAL